MLAECLLLHIDMANGVSIGERIDAYIEKHKGTRERPDLGLRGIQAFLAASAGDVDAVEVVLAAPHEIIGTHTELIPAFLDIARARASSAKDDASAAQMSLDCARARLKVAYPGDDVLRLVERAISDLEREMFPGT